MPIKRAFGTLPKLPNQGSPHQTPASLMIDSRYLTLRIAERWDWNRYVRLCQFLRYTPWELASLVMLSHDAVETFQRKGRLSGAGYRAVAMLLTLVEAHVLAKWTEDVIKDPFPSLSPGGQHDAGGSTVVSAEVPLGGDAACAGASAATRGDGAAARAVAEEETADAR